MIGDQLIYLEVALLQVDHFIILKAPYQTGQPACLEENFVTKPKLSTKMALEGSNSCRSLCWNSPPIDPVEDKLARDPSSVGGPNSDSTSSTPSQNPTPGPDLVSALILAPTPAPVATDELFKKFMKAYLETN